MRSLVLALALLLVVGAMPADASRARAPAQQAASIACVQRVQIPAIPNVMETKWSPDSNTLAVVWFGRIPSTKTIKGYEEQQVTDLLDLRTGTLWPVGVGDEPRWSASGAYLSYWGPDGDELRVVKDSHVVARLAPTIPDVRWNGERLLFIEKSEIREWTAAGVRTVAHIDDAYVPHYPSDDVYFDSDASYFTLSRYSQTGTVQRYLGTTATGAITRLDTGEARYIEWAPTGATLLVRYLDHIELRDVGGGTRTFPITDDPAPAHGWMPDGRTLVLGHVSPTVPAGNAFDAFHPADDPGATATLPNLMGERVFSPDGRYFAGVSRTGTQTTRLEVYRCGTSADATRDVGDSAAREAAIAGAPGRFVRPAAGEVTQFVQGAHTGIDVAAPYGTLVTADDDGIVTSVEFVNVGGRRVCVQRGALESCFYHTSLSLVSVGDHVVRGQPVALVGMTGQTTGPHTHWEVKLAGRIVDPLTY